MDNFTIAENFSLLAKLLDIHGENSFKSRTYSAAAFNIEKLPVQLKDTAREKLFFIKGIGESVGKKVIEMLETGHLSALNQLISNTPPGVIEMLHIKGLGPKKINTVWKEMELESIGELLYACEENRLTLYKGFGEKTQQNIREAIEFYLQHQGSFLYADMEILFPQINNYLEKLFTKEKVQVTGAYRRQELTIDELEFIILEENKEIKPRFISAQPPELLEESANSLLYKLKNGLKLRLYTGKEEMPNKLFFTTGSKEFTDAFSKSFPVAVSEIKKVVDETHIFKRAGIPFIPPYIRESAKIIDRAKKNNLPQVIQADDIKSIIHSHSNWSDGVNTIEEMAMESINRGYEYLVISDHSKSAFYAKGLQEERIREQHRHIDELNNKLSPFRIFKSIECDILNDGSLDYSNNILATFDLVIASVHSNLKMTEEKAMMRLLNAIENPYTTILGHLTGRLLLSRKGYPVDHQKITEACLKNHVVIELNAHPRRLDIDWKYIDLALEKSVMISINPDAHALDGFDDVKYGVLAAQKAGLTKEQNLSSYSLNQFEAFLFERKKKKNI
ncbi:MAG TPA: helix-hairpin-helix domain-containing protein [Chitinophagaceae bacterium]|nr:helix-hairpin-helix domain-containing protein [Chitinophagaceae bacterium]